MWACTKKQQPSGQAPPYGSTSQAASATGSEPMAMPEANQPAGPNTLVAAAGEQTDCPVMGGPINRDIFVEYQDKKVYFCCEACKEAFNKEPAKYLAQLPQFNQGQ